MATLEIKVFGRHFYIGIQKEETPVTKPAVEPTPSTTYHHSGDFSKSPSWFGFERQQEL